MTADVLIMVLSLALPAPSAGNPMQAATREDRPPEITQVFLNKNTRRYDLHLTNVPYGLSRTHVLRFVPRDFEAQTITGMRPLACETCITTALTGKRGAPELGFYEAIIILNRFPHRTQELGDYEDTFHVLGPNQRLVAELKVRHSTVLSTRVDPNRILLGTVTPEKVYLVSLRKKGAFKVGAVEVDDDKHFRVQSWDDQGESTEILLQMKHTYEDTAVSANLVISIIPGEPITIPLSADIREFLRVHPKRLILGVVERGQAPSTRIVISSTSPCRVLSCTSDMDQFKANTVSDSTTETVIDVAFPTNDAMRNGPFRHTLQVSTSLSAHPISIPVYGTLVDRRTPQEAGDAGRATLMKD